MRVQGGGLQSAAGVQGARDLGRTSRRWSRTEKAINRNNMIPGAFGAASGSLLLAANPRQHDDGNDPDHDDQQRGHRGVLIGAARGLAIEMGGQRF